MKGIRLAGYEIVDKLGEGGMGEVWRARDEQLDRIVAIKLLPTDFSGDPDRRARFELEARALAALNHPNIVSVFGAGEHEGRSYIVSELVEGESLRVVIGRGRLPFRKLAGIAVQIAEAIAAAHAAGIVHRDLKPENIMLTPEGRVKVLDFGLAKKATRTPSDATATAALSAPGVVMGTAGYMSPEQVRGQPLDSRSDIFSFGAVLYELASGQPAFTGASAVETMHAVLQSDPPDAGESSASLPPAFNAIVRHCLEKNPDQRFQAAADLAFALSALAPGGTSTSHAQVAVQPATRKPPRKWLWAAVTAIACVALFAAGFYFRGRTSPADAWRFQRITFRTGLVTNARFAPGAQNIIYSGKWDMAAARVYLANPGAPDSRDLQIPDESLLASVSSKQEIAFIAPPFSVEGAGTLSRISVVGGQMRPALENVGEADWAPDGVSMAILRTVNGKARVEYPVGKVIWSPAEEPAFALRISPDGKRVAIAHYYRGSSVAISVVDQLGGQAPRVKLLGVVSDQSPNRIDPALCWSPDSSEVLFRSFDPKEWGTIYAMNLSGRRRVVLRAPGHITLYDVAPDGRLLIRTDNRQEGILGVAPGGNAEIDLSCLDSSDLVGISNDGREIVAEVSGESGGPKGSVYLRKTDGSPPIRLGDGTAWTISPDGNWISGFSSVDSATRRYALLPTGAGEEQVISIPQFKGLSVVFGWLPDNETFLVLGPGKTRAFQNFAWNRKSGALRPIGPETQVDYIPLVSPDSRRILTKGPDTNWWIYSLDGGEPFAVKGLSHHDYPVGWRSDNRSLFIVTHHNENRMFPVSILDLPTGARTAWKDIRPSRPVEQVQGLQIAPDGRAYAYNFIVKISDLYIASPAK